MSIGKIFSHFGKTTPKTEDSQQKKFNDMQKANKDLLQQSMEPLSSDALANTSKGSFQAMQSLQDLNRKLK